MITVLDRFPHKYMKEQRSMTGRETNIERVLK